ncbi:hypothetical protein C7A10_32770, partial [Pseudomonas fluorescens]
VQQDAVAAAPGRQCPDLLQLRHFTQQSQTPSLHTITHGPGRDFGEAVHALAQECPLTAGVRAGEAGSQAFQLLAPGIRAPP